MITPYSKFKKKEDVKPLLESNDFIYSICDNVLFVMKHCIDIDKENYLIVNSNQATVLGLFNKQFRLFSHFVDCYKSNKMEICFILQRIIYEAFIKMLYLIKKGVSVQKQYRENSYRNRLDFYENTDNAQYGYLKIRNKKFILDLEEEGLSIEDIKKSKKPFPPMTQLIKELEKYNKKEKENNSKFYNSLYGIPSDPIHSDWGEIRQLYLEKGKNFNEYYVEVNKIIEGHYRYLILFTEIMIESTSNYINWINSIFDLNTFRLLLSELKRITILIMQCVFDEYNAEDSKYMYE